MAFKGECRAPFKGGATCPSKDGLCDFKEEATCPLNEGLRAI